MEKLIINVAVCGSAPTREQNPAIPHTPEEIAQEALRAWRAGASVVHIHVRDPQTGVPDFKRELFAEALERIRAESDMLVNLTTSGFNLQSEDPGEERMIPIALKPDLCSLDVGSLNFRGREFINPTDWVDKAAKRMQETGVKPEIEVFELGHLRQALDMVKRGLVDDPPYFQFCLGIAWGAPADLSTLMAFREHLTLDCPWSVLGVGPHQLPITTHAMLMGGHVRVGFEDNIYLSRGVLADSNARFVERTVKLAKTLQREVATCEEARAILNIKPKP
ncbi:MAG: 3-keto-5-aminohexanoate cleavage protein [Desulfarculaceae bacterium]|nr:3-keto-5-aminohexanoate cleavage protein [Desulfarculaceae bacterium]MCF8046176.1 3-keto-5-aminohexanoate cleavage protein [Desulfarculaceae bacterium]MCF8066123.1 3-keto-5-aminohexanoate cleavage protein [Desulfarculaceae bacterium]MCF8098849.1 3-keto-5-aminohexanoate cleavage protein [Desulfarculaceae bacterium]MCF8124186.1 3-keto-5-aminohexanoate cleavage protein [Desulfarculaceae bacterium]